MHFKLTIAFFASVIPSTLAAPAEVFARDTCNTDACYSNILKSDNAVASSSCNSFLLQTVSPCPSTITTTRTFTVTAPTSTSTSTVTNTVLTTNTRTSTIPSTTTVLSRTTEQTRVPGITMTTSIAVGTSTTTVTSTAVFTVVPRPGRGGRGASMLQRRSSSEPIGAIEILDARGACPSVLSSAPIVPKEASSCSDSKAYASVCSCLGVKASTTTLAQQTISKTVSSTITITPSAVVTVTATVASTVVTNARAMRLVQEMSLERITETDSRPTTLTESYTATYTVITIDSVVTSVGF